MTFARKLTLISAIVPLLMCGAALAGEHGSKDEAIAMTKKAVAQIKTDGADKVYAAINSQSPAFHDRDLYVTVYDAAGKCLAHGSNAQLVGKDLSGAGYVQDRVRLMKSNASFWQDYVFLNPVSKKLEPKSTYCEVLNATAVCVGIYKAPAQ